MQARGESRSPASKQRIEDRRQRFYIVPSHRHSTVLYASEETLSGEPSLAGDFVCTNPPSGRPACSATVSKKNRSHACVPPLVMFIPAHPKSSESEMIRIFGEICDVMRSFATNTPTPGSISHCSNMVGTRIKPSKSNSNSVGYSISPAIIP